MNTVYRRSTTCTRGEWRALWRAARLAVTGGMPPIANMADPEDFETVMNRAQGRTSPAFGFFDALDCRARIAEASDRRVRAWRMLTP